jgi:hypothetical protein
VKWKFGPAMLRLEGKLEKGQFDVAAHRRTISNPGLAVYPDRPLIGIVLVEDGEEVVRYFADEAEAAAAVAQTTMSDRSLAGAWADLDWQEAVEELDRIRHQSKPTPPIDAL